MRLARWALTVLSLFVSQRLRVHAAKLTDRLGRMRTMGMWWEVPHVRVGQGGLEPPASPLSGVRSNQAELLAHVPTTVAVAGAA